MAMVLTACAARGPIHLKAASGITAELLGDRVQRFNDIMGCPVVTIDYTDKDYGVLVEDGVNSLSPMPADWDPVESGYYQRYRLSDEVDIILRVTDGRIPTWIIYHELSHTVGADHTEDPCSLMWSPYHPLWIWHAFQCQVTDPDERLRVLRRQLGDDVLNYCPAAVP